jgi:hypothetical protein
MASHSTITSKVQEPPSAPSSSSFYKINRGTGTLHNPATNLEHLIIEQFFPSDGSGNQDRIIKVLEELDLIQFITFLMIVLIGRHPPASIFQVN